MSDTARPTNAPAAPNLHAALLDFFRAPGKHQLQLREPAVLFASLREVLQVAAGRTAAGVPEAEAETAQQAATFFVGAALLYPGADHYAIFGLPPRAEAGDLKERYRLLMRLIHPDFAGATPTTWPADAAVRVNKAYEVLSSPTLRREYDETLARPPVARAAPRRPAPTRVPPPPRDDVDRAKLRRGLAWTLSVGFALLVGSMLLGRPEPVQLVQRPEQLVPRPEQPASTPAVATRPVLIEEIGAAIAEATNLLRSATLAAPPAPATPPSAARPAQARPAAAPVALQTPAPRRPEPVPAQPAMRDEAPAQLVLAPPLTPAPPPPMRAEPMLVATPLREAPAIAAPPPPPAPVQVAVAPRSAPPAVPAPSLVEVQPLLNQLLERLESGSSEQMLRLLAPDARNAAGAQSLQRQYDQIVRGARSVRLAQVEFISEPRGGVLFVTSRVRLHPGEPTIGSFGERFAVRAEFASRDGRVVMTSLSGAND